MGAFELGGMTLRSLFSKPETILYPVEHRYVPEGLKGHIDFDADTCILCGICEKRCPTNSIKVTKEDKTHGTWEINRFSCIQCGECWRECPTDSLTMLPTYAAPATVKTSETFVKNGDDNKKTTADA